MSEAEIPIVVTIKLEAKDVDNLLKGLIVVFPTSKGLRLLNLPVEIHLCKIEDKLVGVSPQ